MGSSPPRPAWARPRGAGKAWGPAPVHVASVRIGCLSLRLPGSMQRREIRTRHPLSEEAAMKGWRPGSSRDAVAANENEKGCRLDRTSLLPEMLKIQRTGQRGHAWPPAQMTELVPQRKSG